MLSRFTSWTPIDKGWSGDKKYQVTAADGSKKLLRISPLDKQEMRKDLYLILQQLGDIPMCKAEDFGLCKEGVYTVFSWIEGEDLETALPHMTEAQAYALGVEAGKILHRIHSLPAPVDRPAWESVYGKKLDVKLKKYSQCPLRFAGDAAVIQFIEENRHLLQGRPQCFQHGDYHVGNMMLQENKLYIIDFDRFDFGDPWEEFNRITWCAQANPAFAAGRINGYFDGKPPEDFFRLMALYIAGNMLSSIYWAIPFGQGEVDVMMTQCRDILRWYNDFQTVIPTWYKPYY